jgi:hypothetical protein
MVDPIKVVKAVGGVGRLKNEIAEEQGEKRSVP